ncbi:sec-independent protein translocase protein TatA [Pedobacter steynii]|jgi:sec-independent protein translocase protein TatA|uniref:Sec-independent protein translocase protein TatA n=1 Tax=Pedobacter steynii TaxID=430522 RepID=A0A1G9WQ50_9SPHI|nr:twin-arginine translocase TatA/TatE family subunit [Pedobacter steynii]NQX40361.1 twin-arginine translocase TatA/TatE family subunit [Pedobacter steynii]SDM86590.1 sec-independent protein translocase protein TatA [Pedobacter steynii]
MYTGTVLEFLNMGGGEIMLILAVVLLLFGGKKLPELARGLGKGIRDFKDASEGVKREIHRNINSVGIVDDIDSIIKDTNSNDRHHPTETSLEEQMYPGSSTAKEGIDLDKKEAVASNSTENPKIETDKTQL